MNKDTEKEGFKQQSQLPTARDRACSIFSVGEVKIPYLLLILVIKAKQRNPEEHYFDNHCQKSGSLWYKYTLGEVSNNN